MNTKKIDGTVLLDTEVEAVLDDVKKMVSVARRVKNKDDGLSDTEWTFPETKIKLGNARTDIDRMKILELARRETDIMFHRIRRRLIDHGIDGSSVSAIGFGYGENEKYVDFVGKMSAFLKKGTKDKDDA